VKEDDQINYDYMAIAAVSDVTHWNKQKYIKLENDSSEYYSKQYF
jgi:hypothetical protein